MAKTGMSKFMDFLKLSDPEEDYDDDGLFDDDDDEEEYSSRRSRLRQSKSTTNPSKLVSINSRNNRRSQVFVIKPQDISHAQTVTQYLKEGNLVVINMEGVEIHIAQRIIDFIGGACDALDGSIQGISNNIFIAAPSNVAVTGDLREEILNESSLSPNLNRTY